jgi:microcin C transport system substrate-binding protein
MINHTPSSLEWTWLILTWGTKATQPFSNRAVKQIRFARVVEAFKGDQLDWRTENVAKNWATAYDFPAVLDKRVVKEEFPVRNQGIMQGFVLNTRRAKFSDPRVRRAFNLALDFEEMNKQFFYGAYKRIGSFFEGSELASRGLPTGLELEILETVRGQIPPEVFTTEYKNPVNGSPETVRNNLRAARSRLRDPQAKASQYQDWRPDGRRVSTR